MSIIHTAQSQTVTVTQHSSSPFTAGHTVHQGPQSLWQQQAVLAAGFSTGGKNVSARWG